MIKNKLDKSLTAIIIHLFFIICGIISITIAFNNTTFEEYPKAKGGAIIGGIFFLYFGIKFMISLFSMKNNNKS